MRPLEVLLLLLIHNCAGGQVLLWRSVSVPELSGLSGLPLALLTLNGSELYAATFEGLQWLSPTDLRRYDIFSPGSSFQINRRYRNGSHVQRYYGHQLWKVHETRLALPELRAFWRHFGNKRGRGGGAMQDVGSVEVGGLIPTNPVFLQAARCGTSTRTASTSSSSSATWRTPSSTWSGSASATTS